LTALVLGAAVAAYLTLIALRTPATFAGPAVTAFTLVAALSGSVTPYLLHMWGQTLSDYGSEDMPGFNWILVTLLFIGPLLLGASFAFGLVTDIVIAALRRTRTPG
jgi:hypothetical protein